ncbi:MAG: Alkaline phosphatase synthesis sensor protein PhoR [Lentisphaerae bacterium ADurb.BinA184]|nr:MAG: Alkaline phosphatase synthesis sensor protein PhoR [Lentisphaerae bacterium ADurb.BinA184]
MAAQHRRRLFWLLYPSYLAIAVAALVAMAMTSSLIGHRLYIKEADRGTQALAEILRQPVGERLAGGRFDELDRWCKDVARGTAIRITVTDARGVPVADSEASPAAMDNHRERPEIASALRGAPGHSRRASQTLHDEMMYVALPVLAADGSVLGVVRTARPVTSLRQTQRQSWLRTVQGLALVAAAVAVVSFLLARWLARPLGRMQEGAARLANGDFSGRLRVSHSHEIDALAAALNQMAEQLDDRFHAVTRQRQEMEAILAGMAEGVIAIGPERQIVRLNQAAARMLGVKPGEAVGRRLLEVVRNPALQQVVEQALAGQAPAEGDARLQGEAGEIDVQVRGSRLAGGAGGPGGAVIVLNDVSRLRRLENVRREFAANVSHELRTPVTSIRGFVETLQDGAIEDPATARRFLGILASQTERLNAIIEDLLQLARVEKEHEDGPLAKESCSVPALLRGAVQACAGKASDRGIALVVECPDDLQGRAAPTLLQQAVANLLDNAINYSPQGGRVEVRGFRQGEGFGVSVRDWGCGIAPEHHGLIFERFYRIDKARSRELGGTGLGLAIVKHIMQAHGGRVTVESAPGQGSTFTLTIPG